MLSLNMVTSKGLSTPLIWKSVDKKKLKHNRARYEDQLLSQFKSSIAEDVKVTLLADRGFADQKFFRFLEEELKFNYIIRIKSSTTITNEEKTVKASDWLEKDGKMTHIKDVSITLKKYPIKHFVAVKEKAMKGAWFLVSNLEISAKAIIKNYGKRWKIEPYFRDLKDGRYGFGLEDTHIKSCERRDRLMLVLSLAYALLVILGEAGEKIGFDKKLKVNTVKTRTHSLFRQGQFYYRFFYWFTQEEQNDLMNQFNLLLQNKAFWSDFFDI